jgi:hypothetical protein
MKTCAQETTFDSSTFVGTLMKQTVLCFEFSEVKEFGFSRLGQQLLEMGELEGPWQLA